jgi:hypothetical protein
MRGLGTSRRFFAAPGPLSRNERASHWLVLIAPSRSPCGTAPAATPTPNGMCGLGSVGLVGDLPGEARELACDRDRDGRAFLAALPVQV